MDSSGYPKSLTASERERGLQVPSFHDWTEIELLGFQFMTSRRERLQESVVREVLCGSLVAFPRVEMRFWGSRRIGAKILKRVR